ncbi:methionyl-tRNA formyltransferase [Nitriliruptoraceae bacterium ZYF776]|nr:methionyl-tRNA formyltransferase [Profundirhabdus halotolerans]
MRIVFLGTPAVAVPALDALVAADDVEVVAVVTNPDRPKGRSGTPVPPPVKVAAERHGLPVWQPGKAREMLDDLRAADVDACAIVAYGALLPQDVLDAGGRGFVNLHFSLLPRWRGAAPVQHAIRAGDDVTGVTCFVLDAGMDTGPILATREEPIRREDTSGSLLERLAEVGAPVLVDAVRSLVAGATPTPQVDEGATLAPKVTPDDVAIDWSVPTRTLVDLVRSADPAPGAHTTFRDKRLKVWGAQPAEGTGAPGTVLHRTKRAVVVATGDGAVALTAVQPEGKGRVDGAAFANGYRPEPGERLGA